MLKTRELYDALSPEQQAFIAQPVHEAALPAAGWVGFFGPVAAYDRALNAFRKRLTIGLVLTGVALFLSIFVVASAEEPALLVGPGLLAVVLIGGIVYNIRLRRVDVPNNLLHHVMPLLAVLREDAVPEAPLTLTLDLRGPTDEKQTAFSEPESRFFGYPRITETQYLDPWQRGRVRLADGSVLQWRVRSRIRARKITKKNFRGKIKTKHKHKIKHQVRVRLGVPKKRYVPKEPLPVVRENGVTVSEGAKRYEVTIEQVVVSKQPGKVDDKALVLAPDAVLGAVAHAYQQVGAVLQPRSAPPAA